MGKMEAADWSATADASTPTLMQASFEPAAAHSSLDKQETPAVTHCMVDEV